MDRTTTINPMDVTVLWDDTVVTGYADGTAIKAEHNADHATPKVGMQGETLYVVSADRSGTVTLTLQPTSAILSLMRKDAQSGTSRTIMIRDAGTDSGVLIQASGCRILKTPSLSRGGDGENAEVKIHVPVLAIDEG